MMYLTEKQHDEMFEAAKPLMKWLNENTHAHCVAAVRSTQVDLFEGIATTAMLEPDEEGEAAVVWAANDETVVPFPSPPRKD